VCSCNSKGNEILIARRKKESILNLNGSIQVEKLKIMKMKKKV